MTSEVQGPIQKFLYHLSTEDFSSAEKEIKKIQNIKVQKTFNEEYEKVKKTFGKNK
jgi:phage FluMu protein gp41